VPSDQDGSVYSTFRDIDAEDLSRIFLSQVFAKHGTPTDIVSDRGKHFVSRFLAVALSTVRHQGQPFNRYHPETDGQTERVNQILEQYLHVYINYQQDNWVQSPPSG